MGLVVITGIVLATIALADTSMAPTTKENKADINCVIDNSCKYAKLASEYPEYKILLNEISVRNPVIGCVIQHESGGRHYKDDGTILRGDAGEFGVAQYMYDTFYWFAEKMGWDDANIENPTHQLIITYWAFNHHEEYNWTTYKGCIKKPV